MRGIHRWPVNSPKNRSYMYVYVPLWRHQMETSSMLLALRAENSPATGEFPAQRPVTRSFDVFFDLRLNKRLSEQQWRCWFETLLRSLWRNCKENPGYHYWQFFERPANVIRRKKYPDSYCPLNSIISFNKVYLKYFGLLGPLLLIWIKFNINID